ncbi:hypothetical protein GCM10022226_71820 [Sphaerisporangium flaviroseum]|uniref:Protein kinase domain-containing protein n=1 Tax=Sphaerisporangium flaviroseum TaxID=509199 RepID=A0ABP7JA89_9ACTN
MSPPAAAPLRAEDPEQLGGYRLIGRLGRGGQGVVFLGVSPAGAHVAVKLMHSRLDEERARRRFVGEVEAVRRVAPFCTAQVLDADLDGDRPYIVSEYVEGVSLQEHITTEGPRTGGSLDRLAVGTATALAAIHGAGVVHRDFKPANVLLGPDGPRVIDFGISRMMDITSTTGRVPVGTPAYLSPEQLKGERAGPAADMFGWGLTVAFAASGRHAYAAGSFEATLGRILFGEADLDRLTGLLRDIVVACLADDPAERPSAEEALRRLIGQGAVALPATSPGEVLETGATLAAGSPAGEDDGPSTLTFEPRAGHEHEDPTTLTLDPHHGPSTLTFGPPADHDDDPTTLTLDPDDDEDDDEDDEDGPSTLTFTPDTQDRGGVATVTSPNAARGAQDDVETQPARRSSRWWHAVVAGVAVLTAGAVATGLWWSSAGDPSPKSPSPAFSYAGRWTGTAEHPTAGRVFPVEMHLADTAGPGTMRWGADLHCRARMIKVTTGKPSTLTFRLDEVRGDQCHPGMVWLFPRGFDQVEFQVTASEGRTARYSGTAARAS